MDSTLTALFDLTAHLKATKPFTQAGYRNGCQWKYALSGLYFRLSRRLLPAGGSITWRKEWSCLTGFGTGTGAALAANASAGETPWYSEAPSAMPEVLRII